MKPVLSGLESWQEADIHEALMAAIPGTGLKNGQVLWPLRIAISGKASTPGGAIEVAYLLGKDETLARLDGAIDQLEQSAE